MGSILSAWIWIDFVQQKFLRIYFTCHYVFKAQIPKKNVVWINVTINEATEDNR